MHSHKDSKTRSYTKEIFCKRIAICTMLLAILLVTCQNNTPTPPETARLQSELDSALQQLDHTKKKLDQLQAHTNAPLIHIVYFNLKDDLSLEDKTIFAKAIQKLNEIPDVKNLKYGDFKNLDDPRALSDYEMVMQMNFTGEKAYAAYQAHPIHLALKETAKQFLAAPPATYDYFRSWTNTVVE